MSEARKTSNGLLPKDGHLYWRQLFLDYFQDKGCKHIASDSLIPENDPSLLFTGAGMNQFKDDFTGALQHDTTRATTAQKCMRTPDLENVGRTARHHTFFEMLGFFSFGDFFKKEAIAWIWEFYTSPEWCGLEPLKIRVSVYKDDDEAYQIWEKLFAEQKLPHAENGWIYRLDEDDNFWPAGCPSKGPNGVCGPCSELFYDVGEEFSAPELKGNDNPENNGDRFMELGNIVFTQFERSGPIPGKGELSPLPQKNIDFGGGFERLVMVKEGVKATLDTSLFMPMRHAMRQMANAIADERLMDGSAITQYQQSVRDEELAFSAPGGVARNSFKQDDIIREKRIADHLRACCFMISDGVTPSNDKQGYILRRILRRAYRDGVKLGFFEPFLYRLVDTFVDDYKVAYPSLEAARQVIIDTIKREEADFDRVLVKGMEKLGQLIKKLEQSREQTLSGESAFDLHSTHGLPIDVTRDVLSEHGMRVDEKGFEQAFADFREKSRANSAFAGDVFEKGAMHTTKRIAKPTQFVGYDRSSSEAAISSIMKDDDSVHDINEGDEAVVVLNLTPFYAESGGQIGDSGVIEAPSGRFIVRETKKMAGYHLHIGVMESGTLTINEEVTATIDSERRERIIRNHSATHLMHAALRRVLGDHVHQKGSLVHAEGLRFDFSHPQRVSSAEIAEIERFVNAWIRENDQVHTEETTPDSARERGALMFFGEKYGDVVRMLTMGDNSCELCGGTHVARTGDIGGFRIVSESSVASGVRRIEAVTSELALSEAQKDREELQKVSAMLKTAPDKIVERLEAMQKEIKELKSGKKAAVATDIDAIKANVEKSGEARFLVHHQKGGGMKDLLAIKDKLMQDGVVDLILLAGDADGKAPMMLAVSKPFVSKGLHAGKLLPPIVEVVDGRGGGKPEMAQAGGKDVAKIADALQVGREKLKEALEAIPV